MVYNLKIINTPYIMACESKKPDFLEKGILNRGLMPPLGLAIIKSFLERYDYHVDLDDLDIKLHYENAFSKKKIDFRPLLSKDIIPNLARGKINEELYRLAERILKKTHYTGYDLIGFSTVEDIDVPLTNFVILLSQIIKEKTGSKILLGGFVDSLEFFKNLKYIDYVIAGDHHALLYLLDNLNNQPKRKHSQNSTGHFKLFGKEVKRMIPPNFDIRTPHPKKSVVMNSDYFIKPNFDGLPLEKYSFNNFVTKKLNKPTVILPYKFSIGCPNRCAFCCSSSYNLCYVKNPKDVTKDLEELAQKYKTNFFIFLNDNINPTYDYAERFCRGIKEHNVDIRWSDCANFKFMDKKLLKKLKKSGAVRLTFGLECASPKMLGYINKGVTLKHAKKILKYSNELGIWNGIDLIAGLPYETDEDINSTMKFIEENEDNIDFCNLDYFRFEREALFYLNPENYGLENVQSNLKENSKSKFLKVKFDEKYGLTWEDKKEQIVVSYNKIAYFLQEKKLRHEPNKSLLFNTFYHYDLCGYDKKKVKDVMKQLEYKEEIEKTKNIIIQEKEQLLREKELAHAKRLKEIEKEEEKKERLLKEKYVGLLDQQGDRYKGIIRKLEYENKQKKDELSRIYNSKAHKLIISNIWTLLDLLKRGKKRITLKRLAKPIAQK